MVKQLKKILNNVVCHVVMYFFILSSFYRDSSRDVNEPLLDRLPEGYNLKNPGMNHLLDPMIIRSWSSRVYSQVPDYLSDILIRHSQKIIFYIPIKKLLYFLLHIIITLILSVTLTDWQKHVKR